MRSLRAALPWLVAALSVACAGAHAQSSLRFLNRDPVVRVNDRCRVPVRPVEYDPSASLYVLDADVFRRGARYLDFPPPLPARSQNSLGEVPDSTWFTNRIGAREVSVEELRRGPNLNDGPDRSAPWRIIGSKTAGVAVGFRVRDARGDVYLIKFDQLEIPEMETAAEVIVQRLTWAAGYNVPENQIVFFGRDQLELSPEAEVEDQFGNDRAMTQADVEQLLARVAIEGNGEFRALASRYLPGVPVGGISPEGVRFDDPNDTIPHELRRELRGLYTLYAWVHNVDVKPGNTLDTWVEDPRRPGHHYVIHYLIDFGKALGVQRSHIQKTAARVLERPVMVAGLGFPPRPWESDSVPTIRGVSSFTSEDFDPGEWDPLHPWLPFVVADRFDNYWGAKLVMRFRPEHIRAVTELARFSDARATEHYIKVLLERQRMTGRYWFARVAPLERFEVRAATASTFDLCFDDLLLHYGLADQATRSTYTARALDYEGRQLPARLTASPDGRGHACLSSVPAAGGEEGYTIVELTVSRDDDAMHPLQVHLARAEGRLRVIGILRQ